MSARSLARRVAALVAVGLLLALLGATTVPAAQAAAPAAVPVAVPAAAPVELKQGCLGPDILCDVADGVTGGVKNGITTLTTVAGVAGDLLPIGLPNLPGISGSLPGLDSCGFLDAVCGLIGDLPGLPGGLPGLPGLFGGLLDLGPNIPGLSDIGNPFATLGDIIAKTAADAWTAAMMAIWSAGLYVLRIVLSFSELFLTPDLSPGGPGRDVFAYALWLALALVVLMTMIQLGAAAFKREGKGVARALIGSGQFVVVCACWFLYCATVISACAALTKALMKALLSVNTWPDWDPLGGIGVQSVTDGVVATVLGLLGLVLWIAAIGHILVYLARAAALLVLTATGPLAAAGLVADAGRSWFWKSLRWFHAAAFTPVLMVLVLGIGVQMSDGVAAHLADDTAKSIGTALPAVMLIFISVVAPLALFKLLAFVDPGTPSGASFRQGMALQGGLQGLLSGGGGGGGGGGSTAASSADANGRSAGEQGAEDSTSSRFSGASQGMLGKLGGVGQGLAAGLGLLQSAGAKGTSLVSDEANQSGVGHHTYGPDFSNTGTSRSGPGGHPLSDGTDDDHNDHNDTDGSDDGGGAGGTPDLPTPPLPPTPPGLSDVNPAPPPGQVGQPGSNPENQGGHGGQGPPAGGGPKPPAGGGGGAGGAAASGSVPPPV